MKIVKINTNTTSQKGFVRSSHNNPTFKAYVFNPEKAGKVFSINPLKPQVDKIIELSLKMARRRVKPLEPGLENITTTVKLSNPKKKIETFAWDINKDNRQKYVLFIHGSGQNITNFQSMYSDIVEKTNFAILAPEFRGFGTNPKATISNKTFLEDASLALDYLTNKGIKKQDVYLVAHSLGCPTATKLTLKNKDIKHLVLMSPINSFQQNMNFEETLKNNVSKFALFLYHKMKFVNRPFDDFYGIGKIIKKSNAQVDIIHSKKDTLVNFNSAEAVAKKCKKLSSLTLLETGSHKVDQDKVDVLIDILNKTQKNHKSH